MTRAENETADDGATPAQQTPPRPGIVVLVQNNRPAMRVRFLDEGKPVRVGRGRACDLVLDDDTVSVEHLEISVTPPGFRVHALKSRNGTSVDGTLINQRRGSRPAHRVTSALGCSVLLLVADAWPYKDPRIHVVGGLCSRRWR